MKYLNFEDFIRQDNEKVLKCFTAVVTGPPGIGKTSFCTAMLQADYRLNNKIRKKICSKSIDKINEIRSKNNQVDEPECLYYSLDKTLIKKGEFCVQIEKDELAMPVDDVAKRYYPKGAVVYYSEVDRFFGKYGDKELPKGTIDLFKFHRHNGMTILMDCQYATGYSKTLRDLTIYNINIIDVKHKREKNEIVHTDFFIKISQNKCELYSQENDESRFVGYYSLRHKGNIYKSYNSFSAEKDFSQGLVQY